MDFNEGDKVVVRRNGAKGVVSYAEDGYYAVGMDNGVELEFEDPTLLQLASEYEEERISQCLLNGKSSILANMGATDLPLSNVDPKDFKGMPQRLLPQRGDRKLAGEVIKMIGQIMPAFLDAAVIHDEKFQKLDNYDKVIVLSEMVHTPMVVFMGAAEMGDMGTMEEVLKKSVLNNIFSGSDFVGKMLVGKAKKTLGEL